MERLVKNVLTATGLDPLFDLLRFSKLNDVRHLLKEGDIIEMQRGLYSHYALYLGNGKVMNVCAEDKNKTKALIKEMSLDEVCGDSMIRIRNHEDVAKRYFRVEPKPTSKIISDARAHKDQTLPYEFDFRNCEYYSTLWRYGKGFSTQVAKPGKTPVGGLLLVGAVIIKPVQDVTEILVYRRYNELA